MKHFVLIALSSLALLACGSRRPVFDGGVEEEDAGQVEIDAGWVRGEDPASGWQVAVELPSGAAVSTRLGVSLSSAGDQFGQPLIAGLHEDPNGDLNYDDNRVFFTRWVGLDKKFLALKTVETVGGAAFEHPNRQISIARDASSNRIAIAYIKPQDNSVRFAVSDDDGANFSLSTVTSGGELNSNPSLALHNGVAHLAWKQGTTLQYRTRAATAATWTDASPGASVVVGAQPVSLALDTNGAAGVAFFVATSGVSADLVFWRPGGAANLVASGNAIDLTVSADRRPSVSLTFAGLVPHVAFHLRAVEPAAMNDNTTELFYARGADSAGTSWTVVPVPRNGSATTFHSTSWYQAITVDASGRVNVAADFASKGAQTNCGGPKLARSTDGASFMTCAPSGSPVQFAGDWLSMWPHREGKQTLIFAYDNRANPSLKPGLIMWREP